jgi:hypothetical protein
MYNNTMTNIVQEHPSVVSRQYVLNANDRCDKCQVQAFIKVEGQFGSLYFCGHDYNKIIQTQTGYASLMGFARNVIDEREKLIKK